MTAAPSTVSTVADFFTAEEWSRFLAAGQARARENRTVFVLDESFQIRGERVWAIYIQDRMQRLGLRDLAAKIDLDVFEISPLFAAVIAAGERLTRAEGTSQ